jgi:hypothetical protein
MRSLLILALNLSVLGHAATITLTFTEYFDYSCASPTCVNLGFVGQPYADFAVTYDDQQTQPAGLAMKLVDMSAGFPAGAWILGGEVWIDSWSKGNSSYITPWFIQDPISIHPAIYMPAGFEYSGGSVLDDIFPPCTQPCDATSIVAWYGSAGRTNSFFADGHNLDGDFWYITQTADTISGVDPPSASAVPEPAYFLLVGAVLLLFGIHRRVSE